MTCRVSSIPHANMPVQSFGGEMTGKNYRIDGAAEFYGVPCRGTRTLLDFENRSAGEIDQILTDTMMKLINLWISTVDTVLAEKADR